MDTDTEVRGRSRFAVGATVGLLLVVSYILSIGPIFAFSYSKYSTFLFKNAESRGIVLERLYGPLIHAAESVGADSTINWYAGMCGMTNHDVSARNSAIELLRIAIDAVDAGDVKRAKLLTLSAKKVYSGEYDILGITPEYVFALIERAERRKSIH
jgi:hypothetical protein